MNTQRFFGRWLRLPKRMVHAGVAYVEFVSDFRRFAKAARRSGRQIHISWRDRYPILNERTATMSFEPHYTYHPAWAARIIQRVGPERHVDISSSLHFCTMLSAFVPVEFYDYRPAKLILNGLKVGRCDLTALHFQTDSIPALSCMHVVEHIGLGRYGDPLDPEGDLKAMKELSRVLAVGGSLLFVVPVGQPVIRFNAHRIYAFRQVIETFSRLSLKEFSLVPDNGIEAGLVEKASEELANRQHCGCGCFWFVKSQ